MKTIFGTDVAVIADGQYIRCTFTRDTGEGTVLEFDVENAKTLAAELLAECEETAKVQPIPAKL
jgi:hypothetical protein